MESARTPLESPPPRTFSHADRTTAERLAIAGTNSAVAQRRDAVYRRLLGLSDVVALSIAFSLSAVVFGDDTVTPFAALMPLILVVIAKMAGLYDRDEHLIHKTTLDEVPTLFAITSVIVLVLWLSDDVIIDGNLEQRQILGTWALLFGLILTLRSLARRLGRAITPRERCLIVGGGEQAVELEQQLSVRDDGAEVVGFFADHGASSASGLHDELHEEITAKQVDRVILAADSSEPDTVMFAIRELKAYGVKVSLLPDVSRIAGSSYAVDQVGGLSLLGMRQFEITRSSRLIKRGFDLGVSLALIVIMAPLLAATVVAVRLDSPGPAFYRQRRIGRDGHEFQMYKFRSMREGAHADRERLAHLDRGAQGLFKIPDDPRVTRVGRMIRSYSIDELPQLVNVLRGDMSLVGPRPLVPEEDDQIEGLYRRRLDVPPGMTGHWQVLGSARVPLEEMVKLDYLYAANWSLWGDVQLILRTVPIVLGRRSM